MNSTHISLAEKTFENILPYDGEAIYLGKVLNADLADQWLNQLIHHIKWERDQNVVFGKLYITQREVAWFGSPDLKYTYAGITKYPQPWTEELLRIKTFVEEKTSASYNSCLLNFYHQGSEGMGWHCDNEKSLMKRAAIASLSLGAERKFSFKHKRTKETISLTLANGSLLLMKGNTQENWLHQLPKAKKILAPRINLTFRTVVSPQ